MRHDGSLELTTCRNAIAQAVPSGDSRPENLRRLFPQITGLSATTERQSSFAGKRAAANPSMYVRVTQKSWGRRATTDKKPASSAPKRNRVKIPSNARFKARHKSS